MSELFGLKWRDIDFTGQQISVLRSIVKQTVGPCKTEASQKPVPLDPHLVRTLRAWRRCARFRQSTDWVFASLATQGRLPFWGQALMRHYIRPAALKLGITKRIGWHTFRHSYSTLLKANGADIKVMQELLRHASTRVTLGHIHPSCHARETGRSTGRCCAILPQREDGHPHCCLDGSWKACQEFVPFCAYEFSALAATSCWF